MNYIDFMMCNFQFVTVVISTALNIGKMIRRTSQLIASTFL